MGEYEKVTHTFDPVYDTSSKILILGTFPSVKSREQNFYYGHPQNRFWKVIAALTNEGQADEQVGTEGKEDIENRAFKVKQADKNKIVLPPQTIEEKKQLLLSNHIAVWDVIKSCSIIGSSDSSIKDVVVNDIDGLLKKTNIEIVAANGTKSYDLYMKYAYPITKREIRKLPSTSPANAAWSLERLCEAYREILYL